MPETEHPRTHHLRDSIADLADRYPTRASRVAAVESLLHGPAAAMIRAQAGAWIVDELVPLERLVPSKYDSWRAPVRDAMLFVVQKLSPERLAPKLVEQYELPPNTSYPNRLLRLISKVPALQKIGQVIARNRHLRPELRKALTQLENGIRDVSAEEVRATVHRELGDGYDRFAVHMSRSILKEASVSAVIRFTWLNPASGSREHGVFKVLKNYIPSCFAEDISILRELSVFFGEHRDYGFSRHLIPDTFDKVRRHLEHEVDFLGEQSSLQEASIAFKNTTGVRIPRLISPLCTTTVTALSEEHGEKVTSATRGMRPKDRRKLAQRLAAVLVGQPLLSSAPSAIFHADPHAGNILFNKRTHDLVLLDWALAEHLSLDQRRQLARLFAAVVLRNVAMACDAICDLAERSLAARQKHVLHDTVEAYIEKLPAARLPRFVHATTLLEEAAFAGIQFPSALIMFSKALFTLDAILDDVSGDEATTEITIALQTLKRWVASPTSFGAPLVPGDWIAVQLSALLYCGRMGVKCEEYVVNRLLKAASNT